MNPVRSIVGSGVAGLILAAGSWGMRGATVPDTYQVIIDRNPFELKPTPPPAPPAPAPTADPNVDVKLTGFTEQGNVKKVYLVVPDKNHPKYLALREHEKQDGVEVLQIDPNGETAKIRNAGTISVLTFAKDGMKSANAPNVARGRSSRVRYRHAPPLPGAAARAANHRGQGPTIVSRQTNAGLSPGANLGYNARRALELQAQSRPSPNAMRSVAIPPRTVRLRSVPTIPSQYQDHGQSIAARQLLQEEATQIARPNIPRPPMPGIPNN